MLFQAEEALSTVKLLIYHENKKKRKDVSYFKKKEKVHQAISKVVNNPSAQVFPDQVRWRNCSKISFCYH